jgi:uncharacterized SAM-binding protein YcdF (DUF218 family)
MREFLSILILPLSILYLLILLCEIFKLLKRKKATKWLFLIAAVWFLITSTTFIPHRLIRSLETQYQPLLNVDRLLVTKPVYIIVLGGGHSDDKNLPPNSQLSLIALGRLAEGIRIHHLIHDSKLVLSGYNGRLTVSHAEVLSKTAISLGVNPEDIEKLPEPKNTSDEANIFFKTFGKEYTLIIVTDAVHMARAMLLFREKGLHPIAAPTNYFLKTESVKNPWRWIPESENIKMMETAIHEYTGIFWSNLGGK